MALTTKERNAIWQGWLEAAIANRDGVNVWSKPDLLPVPDAVDAWLTANAASFNNALPEPFKSDATKGATADEKALMLSFVGFARVNPSLRQHALDVLGRYANGS